MLIDTHCHLDAAEFEGEEVDADDVALFERQNALPAQPFAVVGPNNGGYFGEGV